PIPGAVRVELESRFAHRPVQRDEEWDLVGAAIFRGEPHLWVHGRAGAAGRGLRMAAGAAVEVHSRAEPIRHGFDRFEVSLAGIEEFQLPRRDRKSTRLNSSHVSISYAVFCLK